MTVSGKKAGLIIAVIAIAIIIPAAIVSSLPATPDGDSAPSAMVAEYPDRMYGGIDTSNGSPMLGDLSAPVTIVEFGDYQCHFCALWYHETSPHVKANLVDAGMVNLIYVDFAFLGKDSPVAAEATYCAHDQGMYWEYHGILYESQQDRIDGGWASPANLRVFATELGLDIDEFNECMSSHKYAERVKYNTLVGSELGVDSTPTFFVVGSGSEPIVVPGAHPYSTFVRAVNSVE